MKMPFFFDSGNWGLHQDIQLRDLAGTIIKRILPVTTQKRSFVINDIPPSIMVTTDKNILSTLISELLQLVLNRQAENCIRLTAKTFSSVVLLFAQSKNQNEEKLSIAEFVQLQPLAERIGGCLTISNQEKNSGTLALSFADFAKVA